MQIFWILDHVSAHSKAESVSLSFIGTDVHHKMAVSHNVPFGIAWRGIKKIVLDP
jgi:hypothetical protein